MTQTWDLPRGCITNIDFNGLWYLGAENLYYLNQIQAFLGVKGVSVSLGSVFELQRSLYALFVKSLWFMHPITAGIVINILFWMLYCFCIQYIIKSFSPLPIAQAIGGIFVASGQGFLHSVGEISPHILGYGAHYLIFALACYHRIWQRPFNFNNQFAIYATVGLLQLAYDSAWLSIPILMPVSFYTLYNHQLSLRAKMSFGGLLLAAALIPSFSFSIFTGLFLKKGGTLLYLFGITKGNTLILLKTYLLVVLEGFLSYGPILILGYMLALFFSLKQKHYGILYLWVTSLLLFFACGILMIGVGGRGYVTFSFSPVIILLATYGLYQTWKESSVAKAFVCILLVSYVAYNNSPLFQSAIGNNWILQGFSNGYINVLRHSNIYKSFECDAFN